jgi:hemerythrin-like domain-containing protein
MELTGRVPDFDQPIDALYICHDNILRRIDQIDALAEAILCEGRFAFDRQAEVWREIFSFFRHSVGNHTKDEEGGLFPMLERELGEKVALLHADHERATQIEAWLVSTFEKMTAGEAATETVVEFARRARELAHFYRVHISEENEILFPAARRILSPEQLRDLGAQMRRNRRIEIDLPGAS